MRLDRNIDGEPMIRMGATEKELEQTILVIDDMFEEQDGIDEEFLLGFRKKLANKLRLLRKEVKNDSASQ